MLKTEILFVSFLYILGGIQVLFISGYLFAKKNKRTRKSLYFTLILMGVFFTLYDYFIIHNNLQKDVAPFILISYIFQLAYAPLAFLLIKNIVNPKVKSKKSELLHFLPALIHLLYGFFSFHIYPLEYKIDYLDQIYTSTDQVHANNIIFQVFNLLIVFQIIVYLVKSYELLRKYEVPMDFRKPIQFNVLRSLFNVLVGINIILIISSLNVRLFVYGLSGIDIGLPLLVLISIYLFYISYFVVLKPEVFEGYEMKYQSNLMNTNEKEDLMKKLELYMEEKKPHRNEKLTIKMLAEQIDITPRQLSQIVNQNYGYNFSDFINLKRVKESQKLLLSESKNKLSILGISYEVGFNSKSSFYSAFKKFTGTTPSDYQKKLETKKK